MTGQAYVFEATRENFPQLVLENSRKGPVLVDFWATYAGPSLRQRELLLRLVREFDGRFLLVTVDAGSQKDITREFGVKSLPSCKLFRNGKPVESLHGMQTEVDYREMIGRHIVPLADKVRAAALIAWERGDHDKAIQVLAEGAVAEPHDPALPLLLAKLLVRQERFSDAYRLLSSLPEGPRDHPEIRALQAHVELIRAGRDARPIQALESLVAAEQGGSDTRFTLAAVALMADEYDIALEQLDELHRRDPDYRDGLPRRALMVLLDTLDAQDERVRRFRQSLFDH